MMKVNEVSRQTGVKSLQQKQQKSIADKDGSPGQRKKN